MDGELVVKLGKSKGRTFVLKKGQRATIGRGVKADLQLFDEGLSRLHCSIENLGSHFVVSDLESANGTYVNGKPVAASPAYAGDEITIGLAVLGVRGPVRVSAEGVTAGDETVALAREDAREGKPKRGGTELVRKFDPAQAGMLSGEDDRSRRDLTTLYRVTNAINAHRDPRDLADSLAETVLAVMRGDRAAVLLKDRRTGAADPIVVRERGSDLPSPSLAVSRTVVAEVLEKGVMALSRNVPEDKKYAAGESLIMQQVKSVMCVPLLAQGEVIGALYVDNRTDQDAFDERDLELLAAIGNQAGVALHRVGLLSEVENLFFSSMRSLVAVVDQKDGYTHGHSERVTAFAMKLAKEIGLSEHEVDVLRLAGLLHDLGKIGVPDRVLNKPGELTDEEFELVKRHPVHGAEIISNIQSPYIAEIIPAVRHHHEYWNGTMYPDGLAGEETPLLARVLALADAFDAMTSDRPYRKGLTMDRAAEIVRDCSGTQFDPELAKALLRLHERGELVLPKTMALKYTTMATPNVP